MGPNDANRMANSVDIYNVCPNLPVQKLRIITVHVGLSLPRKNVVRLTDRLNMIIAVDWDVKPQNNDLNSCWAW